MANNARKCNNDQRAGLGGFRLFGVHLEASSSSPNNCPFPTSSIYSPGVPADDCSDKIHADHVFNGSAGTTPERKKGVPWTEREHMLFLIGLEKLGKGDWRGISRSFVGTRSPTQVASHAQKYFLRLASVDKKKRRSRLFDTVCADSGALVTCPKLSFQSGSGQVPSSEHEDSQFDLNIPDASTHFLAKGYQANQ